MKEYKHLQKILSYLFYGFLIGAFLVPDEYKLLDIHLITVGEFLIVPFNEYTIGLTLSLQLLGYMNIIKEIINIDKK